jgi:uncharacterized pyridoxamine 5'-phosphate oxidase family protein
VQQDEVDQVMNDPLAQELMGSNIPARMAYTGNDGSPRVIPIGFHWNGEQLVVCTAPNAYKVRALAANPKVALTIDTNDQPPKVLLVRGTATMDIVDGVPLEYLEGAKKVFDEQQFEAFETQVRSFYKRMARIAITPEWAKLLDFETRIPSAIEELARLQAESESGSSPEEA